MKARKAADERVAQESNKIFKTCFYVFCAAMFIDLMIKINLWNPETIPVFVTVATEFGTRGALNPDFFFMMILQAVLLVSVFLVSVFMSAAKGIPFWAADSDCDKFPKKRYAAVSAAGAGIISVSSRTLRTVLYWETSSGTFWRDFMGLIGSYLLIAAVAFAVLYLVFYFAFCIAKQSTEKVSAEYGGEAGAEDMLSLEGTGEPAALISAAETFSWVKEENAERGARGKAGMKKPLIKSLVFLAPIAVYGIFAAAFLLTIYVREGSDARNYLLSYGNSALFNSTVLIIPLAAGACLYLLSAAGKIVPVVFRVVFLVLSALAALLSFFYSLLILALFRDGLQGYVFFIGAVLALAAYAVTALFFMLDTRAVGKGREAVDAKKTSYITLITMFAVMTAFGAWIALEAVFVLARLLREGNSFNFYWTVEKAVAQLAGFSAVAAGSAAGLTVFAKKMSALKKEEARTQTPQEAAEGKKRFYTGMTSMFTALFLLSILIHWLWGNWSTATVIVCLTAEAALLACLTVFAAKRAAANARQASEIKTLRLIAAFSVLSAVSAVAALCCINHSTLMLIISSGVAAVSLTGLIISAASHAARKRREENPEARYKE